MIVHKQRESRSTRLITSPAFFAICLGAIVIAAAVSLVWLQRYSAAQYRQSVEASNLGIQTYDASDRAWIATSTALSAETVNPAISQEAALAAFDSLLPEYSASVSRAPMELKQPTGAFLALLEKDNELLHAGQNDAAFGIMNSSLASLASTQVVIHAAAARFALRANSVNTYTQIGSIAVFAAALVAIGLVLVLYRKVRRTIELERVQQEVVLQSEARLRSLSQNSSSVVTVLDASGTIRYQSATVETLLGYGQDELIMTAFIDLVKPEDYDLVADLMAQVISQPGAKRSVDCRLRMKRGAWVLSEVIAQNLTNDPNVQGIVMTATDISQRKALEEQLTHQAFHDPLTGLPNRLLFRERLEHAIERRSQPDVYNAVLFLDVDDFKTVNDSMGHLAGDEFLVKVAERLRKNARLGDTVSRFGGDEFALLLEDISRQGGNNSANRILDSMKEPFWIRDHAVQGSLSIGLVFADGDKPDANDLLRDADTAMYIAKARGKGRVEVFSPAMHEVAVGRMDIEAEVRAGIKEQQFEVYYQPVLSCAGKVIVGFEALVRWNHPQRGLLLPSDFMKIAEDTGLILPLGEQVLMQACKQAVLWQRRYPANPPMTVAVNLSARELAQPFLLDRVTEALRDSGLAPESLILEITETVLLPKSIGIIEKLEALRGLGVKLAIDDFGTGYASLTYLHNFPVDIVKIDKSFVDGISDGAAGSAFSDAIVTLARDLSLSTVAEGVERSGQLERLNDIGCDLWQGFLYSEALSQVDMERLLANPTEGFTAKSAA